MSGSAGTDWYTGGVDFAVLPRAVSEKDTAGRIRVGFVHHWSSGRKEGPAACCTCRVCVAHHSQVLLDSIVHMPYLR